VRIGILSDTHGICQKAEMALAGKDLDMVLHAGDVVSDARRMESIIRCEVIAVAGNCDVNAMEPLEKILHLAGKKVLLTHGHIYRVKFGLDKLFYRARELSVDAVVYGHTHVPVNTVLDGILFFNPGSPSLPKGDQGTYGLWEIVDGDIRGFIESV
jgi:putative phosphoesterase